MAGQGTATTRLLFLLFLGIGTVGVTVGNILDSRALAMVMPIVCLVLYGLLGNAFGRNIPREIFADTVYYQGFLFTIIALVLSLFFQNPAKAGLEAIVGNFALALLTTIVGLVWRVVLISFSAPTEEARQTIQDSLDQTSRRLRDQLERLHGDLSAFHDVVLLSTSKAVEEATANLKQAVVDARTEIARGSQSFSQQLSEQAVTVNETWKASLGSLQQRLGKAMFELQEGSTETARRLDSATQGLLDAMERLELPSDAIVRPLGPAIESLRAALDSMAMQAQNVQSSSALPLLGTRLEAMASDVGRLAAGLGASATSSEEILTTIGRHSAHQKELTRQLTEALDTAERLQQELLEQFESYLSAARIHRDEIEEGSQAVTQAVALFRDQLTQAAMYLKRALSES